MVENRSCWFFSHLLELLIQWPHWMKLPVKSKSLLLLVQMVSNSVQAHSRVKRSVGIVEDVDIWFAFRLLGMGGVIDKVQTKIKYVVHGLWDLIFIWGKCVWDDHVLQRHQFGSFARKIPPLLHTSIPVYHIHVNVTHTHCKFWGLQNSYKCYYCPSTNFQERNIFSRVCPSIVHSVHGRVPFDHYPWSIGDHHTVTP